MLQTKSKFYANKRMKQQRIEFFFETDEKVHDDTEMTIKKRLRQYKTQTDLNIHFKRKKICSTTHDDDILDINDENVSDTTNEFLLNEARRRFKRGREHSPSINATHTMIDHVEPDNKKRSKFTTHVVDPYIFCHPNNSGSRVSFN